MRMRCGRFLQKRTGSTPGHQRSVPVDGPRASFGCAPDRGPCISIPVVGDGLRRTKPGIRHERKQHSAGGARGAGGAPITREGRYVKCDNTDGRILPVVPKSQR